MCENLSVSKHKRFLLQVINGHWGQRPGERDADSSVSLWVLVLFCTSLSSLSSQLPSNWRYRTRIRHRGHALHRLPRVLLQCIINAVSSTSYKDSLFWQTLTDAITPECSETHLSIVIVKSTADISISISIFRESWPKKSKPQNWNSNSNSKTFIFPPYCIVLPWLPK